MRVLIHRATNLTLDPRIGDLHVDILVEGSRIVAVAPSIPIDDAEVIAAQRMIALPGSSIPVATLGNRCCAAPLSTGHLSSISPAFAASWAASTLLTISMSQTTWARAGGALDTGITTLYDC